MVRQVYMSSKPRPKYPVILYFLWDKHLRFRELTCTPLTIWIKRFIPITATFSAKSLSTVLAFNLKVRNLRLIRSFGSVNLVGNLSKLVFVWQFHTKLNKLQLRTGPRKTPLATRKPPVRRIFRMGFTWPICRTIVGIFFMHRHCGRSHTTLSTCVSPLGSTVLRCWIPFVY